MDLSTYKELTGNVVPTSKEVYMNAQLQRATSMMETMLGFALYPDENQNLYKEQGQSQFECSCLSVLTQPLNPPDTVVGAYRLFHFNELDKFFHIDPFITLHAVKLVRIIEGADPSGLTLKKFKPREIRLEPGPGGIQKYLQRCRTCMCYCECTECVQLAVDADWRFVDKTNDPLPNDLKYVMCDMVDWYSNPKRYVKMEMVTSHRYMLGDEAAQPPETRPANMAIIKKYAGPMGTASVMPV